MSSTRRARPVRELSWDSLPSRSGTEDSRVQEASFHAPENTPPFGWTSPSHYLSSSVAAEPITPRTSPPRLIQPQARVEDVRKPVPAQHEARALTFDSVDSDVEVITPPRVTTHSIKTVLSSPRNLKRKAPGSAAPGGLPQPKRVFSLGARLNKHMSWRHVSNSFSSSPPASSDADESSDVDVDTLGGQGSSDTQMSDLQLLKLEIDDVQDAPPSSFPDVQETTKEPKGDQSDSDLEIIDVGNKSVLPKFTQGRTHKDIASLVKQQATKTGTSNRHGRDRAARHLTQLLDAIPRSFKEVKPVSPWASSGKTPAAKQKQMMMSVELPPRRPSRVPRSNQIPLSTFHSNTQALGKSPPDNTGDLHGDLNAQGSTALDSLPDQETENLQERERSTRAQGDDTWRTKGNVRVEGEVGVLPVVEESSDEEGTLEDENEWTSPTGLQSRGSAGPLSNCIQAWAVSCDWEAEGETNPLWDLTHERLMGEHVMDHTVAYLVYHAKLMETLPHRRVCLVPASLFGAMHQMHLTGTSHAPAASANRTPKQLQELLVQRGMVWTEQEPPSRIVMPVVDNRYVHCYLWYGDIKPKPGRRKFNVELKYLDSLACPSKELLAERFSVAKAMIDALVPQIDGDVTYTYEHIEGYRQDPRTLDCGYFVCQAVSALAFFRDEALRTLQPVPLVKVNMRRILEACADRALLRLSHGLVSKKLIMLHGARRIAPPPWTLPKATPPLPTQRPRWRTPEYSRSLSEPRDNPRTVREGRSHPASWQAVFGCSPSPDFQPIDPESAVRYLDRLGDQSFELPLGLLNGVSSAAPDFFLDSLFLRNGPTSHVPWLPGISVVDGGDEEELERTEDCLSLRKTCEALSHLRRGKERSLAVLTGSHAGHPIRMDWIKDSLDLEDDWLSASLDIDSLSLTADDPKFTMPAALHAYPPRSSTLTTDNGLSVTVNNVKTPLSHIPNFTFLSMGQNNQFRVNLFFPHYEKGRDKGNRHITMMNADDFKTWYEEVVLPALQRLSWNCPDALYNTYLRLSTELPKSYSSAESHCVNGPRSFTGYKVIPEILNLLLSNARDIVDETLSLARFRGFFYHIVGINLKAVCEVIPERSKGNPMLHVLQQYPIVDWSAQNYCDIAVDVGLEINVCRDKLPDDLDDITLVWKLDALRSLVSSSWRRPHMDAYMHSHVVGGLSSKPRVHVALWFYYMHFYMKDKTLTYIHRDNSIGTGFSPEHGIQGAVPYHTQTRRLQEVWADGCGSYGARVEWRVGLRTANEILQRPAGMWLERFTSAGAIVAVRTADVVRMKTIMLDSYTWFFGEIQKLSSDDRNSLPVALLASMLTYFIQGLVRAPGEMSSHRSMVKDMQIISRARRFGIASLPLGRLGPDLLRISGRVTVERYPILKYLARKNPAGARIKHSNLLNNGDEETEFGSATEGVRDTWTDADQKWVGDLVNRRLAGWLWAALPVPDQLQDRLQGACEGPLRISKWRGVTAEGVKHGWRSGKRNGFKKVHTDLFPPNWILQNKGNCWATLQGQVLDPILERIAEMDPGYQAQFSAQIRRAITALIMQWEFLPSTQKGVIWSYSGTGRTRTYMIHKNPEFTRG